MNHLDHTFRCAEQINMGYPCTCPDWYTREGYESFDGPGTMSVTITYTDGVEQTFDNILVGIKGEPITYKDHGRVEFESAGRDPILYTVLNVRSISTRAS